MIEASRAEASSSSPDDKSHDETAISVTSTEPEGGNPVTETIATNPITGTGPIQIGSSGSSLAGYKWARIIAGMG